MSKQLVKILGNISHEIEIKSKEICPYMNIKEECNFLGNCRYQSEDKYCIRKGRIRVNF
ncbi:hypothetical protein HZA33_00020 [Candidatus Pacearchaeota archaeon]|nr:hypothetical protein [Candidatus Pacearchaeota archaeon]